MKRTYVLVLLALVALLMGSVLSSCDDAPGLKIDRHHTCKDNSDCKADEICLGTVCVVRSPFCPPEENCYEWQVCDRELGRCVDRQFYADEDSFEIDLDSDKESIADSDDSSDESDTIDSMDLDDAPSDADDLDSDPNADSEDGAELDEDVPEGDGMDLVEFEDSTSSCVRDADCGANSICVCDEYQCSCVPDCTISGCGPDEGRCNPNTGHCEWCDPQCEEGESCNYSPSGWYCGKPCEPPCPDGYACFEDSCIELVCPSCPPCYVCSASTGYVCKYDASSCTDGDVDIDQSMLIKNHPSPPAPLYFMQCLPATSPCTEGVSNCCSGACVMGFCL